MGSGGVGGAYAGRVGLVGLDDPAGLWGASWAMASAFRPEWPAPLTWAYAANRALGLALASLEPSEPADDGREVACFCCLGAEGPEGDPGVAGAATLDNRSFYTPGPGPDGFRWPLRRWHAYIANVAVLREARRRGVARALLAAAEERAARWGCNQIFLTVEAGNDAALSLYEGKCGFARIDGPHFFERPGRGSAQAVAGETVGAEVGPGEEAAAPGGGEAAEGAPPAGPPGGAQPWLERLSEVAKDRLWPVERQPVLCTRYSLGADGVILREGDTDLIVLHKSL